MKRTIVRSSKQPIARDDYEYAALHDRFAGDLEDRISARNLDSEDERAAVEVILHGMIHDMN